MISILDSHLENYLKNKWITVGRRRGYRKMILVIQASYEDGPNHICRCDEEKDFMLKLTPLIRVQLFYLIFPISIIFVNYPQTTILTPQTFMK